MAIKALNPVMISLADGVRIRPDLLLLDIACRRQRNADPECNSADETLATTPVIILTASSTDQTKLEALEARPRPVSKPVHRWPGSERFERQGVSGSTLSIFGRTKVLSESEQPIWNIRGWRLFTAGSRSRIS